LSPSVITPPISSSFFVRLVLSLLNPCTEIIAIYNNRGGGAFNFVHNFKSFQVFFTEF
jgi:hypothetical protein